MRARVCLFFYFRGVTATQCRPRSNSTESAEKGGPLPVDRAHSVDRPRALSMSASSVGGRSQLRGRPLARVDAGMAPGIYVTDSESGSGMSPPVSSLLADPYGCMRIRSGSTSSLRLRLHQPSDVNVCPHSPRTALAVLRATVVSYRVHRSGVPLAKAWKGRERALGLLGSRPPKSPPARLVLEVRPAGDHVHRRSSRNPRPPRLQPQSAGPNLIPPKRTTNKRRNAGLLGHHAVVVLPPRRHSYLMPTACARPLFFFGPRAGSCRRMGRDLLWPVHACAAGPRSARSRGIRRNRVQAARCYRNWRSPQSR